MPDFNMDDVKKKNIFEKKSKWLTQKNLLFKTFSLFYLKKFKD